MKNRSFNIYLVMVNREPTYSSLSEDDAREIYLQERRYREPGYVKEEREIDFKTIKVDIK